MAINPGTNGSTDQEPDTAPLPPETLSAPVPAITPRPKASFSEPEALDRSASKRGTGGRPARGKRPVFARRQTDNRLVIAALICLLLAPILRAATHLDEEAARYRPRDQGVSQIAGGDWLTGMLLGFRLAVADMMWIQVDTYFHEGRYDKILPICYVITAMDPGWIDVYSTGAWHLGYNFGDRRLVPAAIAFDQRGVNNNPENYDIRYELGWMDWSRGYYFAAAARHFRQANKLGLRPVGKRHALAHALEDSGDLKGALEAWKQLSKEDKKTPDPVPPKQIFLLNMREQARADLHKHPVQVHLSVKITRKGPRVLHVEGVLNLPKYSKVFYDLRDADWKDRVKQSLAWQMKHYTLYSQTDTTLEPESGLFQGEVIDFYQGDLKIHQGDKQYAQFPTEPPLPIVNGHMQLTNGYFHFDIDMAKQPDQYPLESNKYELILFVNPRMEPITTQDIISWDGSGMSGPLVHRDPDGLNELKWTYTLTKSQIE